MNNEDMSELFSKFSNMINQGNIPDEMKNILSSLSSENGQSQNNKEDGENKADNNNKRSEDFTSGIDIETIMKMKNIMDKMKSTGNDPRANLLLSLKPYLKESRKDKVDQYVKMLNMGKAFELFNNFGGEAKK